MEGVVSGLVSGSQRKLHAIPKDEDTQAGGDTYLTQDQQNPERERGVGRMVGRRVDPLHRRRFDLYVNRRWRPMAADVGECTACRATLSPRRNNPRNMVYK